MHFKINLTMVSILLIVLFFNLPFYNNWLNTNLLNPQMNIVEQSKHMGLEERKTLKYGYSYLIYKEIVKACEGANIANSLVLLPPDAYLKKERITDLVVVEPSIYYYFTGQKAVWYNSPNVQQANCAIAPGPNHKVMLRKINGKEDLNQILDIYRKYKLDL
jgi:hypothetical protein